MGNFGSRDRIGFGRADDQREFPGEQIDSAVDGRDIVFGKNAIDDGRESGKVLRPVALSPEKALACGVEAALQDADHGNAENVRGKRGEEAEGVDNYVGGVVAQEIDMRGGGLADAFLVLKGAGEQLIHVPGEAYPEQIAGDGRHGTGRHREIDEAGVRDEGCRGRSRVE